LAWMFNREHSTHNDSSRCSDSPKCFVTIRSIQNAHCHSSRHSRQNQMSGDLIYLALTFAPVYVGFQRGSPSHAHFAHFIIPPPVTSLFVDRNKNKYSDHIVHLLQSDNTDVRISSETPAVIRPTIPTNSSCSYFSKYDFQFHHVRI